MNWFSGLNPVLKRMTCRVKTAGSYKTLLWLSRLEDLSTFVCLREMIATHKDLARKLEALEKKYDVQFKIVFDAVRELMAPPEPNKRKIGSW